MADQGQEDLRKFEQKIDPNKTYLITGASLQKLVRAIRAARPIAGAHIAVKPSSSGSIIAVVP